MQNASNQKYKSELPHKKTKSDRIITAIYVLLSVSLSVVLISVAYFLAKYLQNNYIN